MSDTTDECCGDGAMNAVCWFEIPATDMDRAKTFYEAVLEVELSLQTMEEMVMAWFPMNMNAMGATGTLVKHEMYTPSHAGTMVYFGVADIEATLARVDAAGGKTLRAKMSIGPHGFIGIAEDTEGNRIGLHSMA